MAAAAHRDEGSRGREGLRGDRDEGDRAEKLRGRDRRSHHPRRGGPGAGGRSAGLRGDRWSRSGSRSEDCQARRGGRGDRAARERGDAAGDQAEEELRSACIFWRIRPECLRRGECDESLCEPGRDQRQRAGRHPCGDDEIRRRADSDGRQREPGHRPVLPACLLSLVRGAVLQWQWEEKPVDR
ncbi:MAG TPA: hypothetical protein DCP69_09450 [Candidatus Omnitrophica bacterium]|nr:hypothetical protein [Candidatus Omnitrophota bacterium]